MTDIFAGAFSGGDPRWVYDDPSGVPETPLEVRVPEALCGSVERAAAREGLTAPEWLLNLVWRGLATADPKAV